MHVYIFSCRNMNFHFDSEMFSLRSRDLLETPSISSQYLCAPYRFLWLLENILFLLRFFLQLGAHLISSRYLCAPRKLFFFTRRFFKLYGAHDGSCRDDMSTFAAQPTTHCITRPHTATPCNTVQHTATHCNTLHVEPCGAVFNTLQHRNTLQYTAIHCNTLQHTATHCNTLQHTATHCNTS